MSMLLYDVYGHFRRICIWIRLKIKRAVSSLSKPDGGSAHLASLRLQTKSYLTTKHKLTNVIPGSEKIYF